MELKRSVSPNGFGTSRLQTWNALGGWGGGGGTPGCLVRTGGRSLRRRLSGRPLLPLQLGWLYAGCVMRAWRSPTGRRRQGWRPAPPGGVSWRCCQGSLRPTVVDPSCAACRQPVHAHRVATHPVLERAGVLNVSLERALCGVPARRSGRCWRAGRACRAQLY